MGWWSLAPYNKQGGLLANPIGRYAIGDQTPGLKVNADGSFSLFVQAEQPSAAVSGSALAPIGIET